LVPDDPSVLSGRRVLAIEDGPTLTHGGMRYGAAVLAARRPGATLVDLRPFAVGEIAETLQRYPHVRALPVSGWWGTRDGGGRHASCCRFNEVDANDCEEDSVKREDEKLRELTQEMEQLQSVTDKLRHHVAELDARVTRLEVREELWEEPSAAGDEAVPE
jgi:hypothetical protein